MCGDRGVEETKEQQKLAESDQAAEEEEVFSIFLSMLVNVSGLYITGLLEPSCNVDMGCYSSNQNLLQELITYCGGDMQFMMLTHSGPLASPDPWPIASCRRLSHPIHRNAYMIYLVCSLVFLSETASYSMLFS